MYQSSTGNNKALVGIIVVVLLGIAATAVFIASINTERNDSIASTDTVITSQSSSSDTNSTSNFESGDYSAKGSYLTPGGTESIDVKVTLADNVVTSASVTQNAISGEAKEFQSRFASGFQTEVVGKNINEVNLSRVAGSSLTPVGFNSALEDIKDEARA